MRSISRFTPLLQMPSLSLVVFDHVFGASHDIGLPKPPAKEAIAVSICVANDWKLGTVHVKIKLPDDLTSADCKEIEEGIGQNFGALAHLLKGC